MILLTIQLTDVGIVAHGVKIVFTEDLSINWVPVLGAQRGIGEVGTHLNPSSSYNRSITGEVGRGISQPEITITETLGDHCSSIQTKVQYGIFSWGELTVKLCTEHCFIIVITTNAVIVDVTFS